MEPHSAATPGALATDLPVGVVVKARRRALGLTLDVLARGSGVSRAMLSDVERGQRSPTLKILRQIAMGLGCRVADLLDEPAPDCPIVVRAEQHALVVDEVTGVERRTLASPWLPAGIELVRYLLPAGTAMHRSPAVVRYLAADGRMSLDYPPNPHDSREHVSVEQGRVAFAGAGVATVLSEGDSVAYRLVGGHDFTNPGPMPCRLALFLDTRSVRGA